MIYFDNAATTFPKPYEVIHALNKCVKKYCGNPGRSAHTLSIKSSEKIYETRELISEMLSFHKPENVVFSLNATHALNQAIKTSLKPGDHVLISDIEHNSVIRPIEAMRNKCGIEYEVFCAKNSETEIEAHIKENTACIIANLCSNVTGETISLEKLSKLRQKYNLMLIVDASQYIGHEKINLKETPVDVLCAPSHKALFGIQGSGFAVFCDEKKRDTFAEGGSGSESLIPKMPDNFPERFEAGTLPTPAIASLSAGISYINKIGIDAVKNRLEFLGGRAIDMMSNIKGIQIFSAPGSVISFTHHKFPPHYIADKLNERGICVRSGYHCAPLIHKRLGTLDGGTVRLSFSYLNTDKELDIFYKELKSIFEYK